MRYIPKFDPNYKPAYIELNNFFKTATKEVRVAVERENGLMYVKNIPVNDNLQESYLIKFHKVWFHALRYRIVIT